jgi:plastocyanin
MSRNKFWLLVALCCALVALVACGGGGDKGGETGGTAASTEAPAAAPAGAPAADAANAGGVSGTVTYAGADSDTEIKMNADPVCAGLHKTPVDTNNINTKDGKLADVFVYVKSGLTGTYPAPAEAKTLDQQGCLYHPKVFGIQVGQKLTIKNSDPTLHNIHALPAKNTEFNQGQPFQNMQFDKTFDKPEVLLHFKCDVHPWMSSFVGVVENPFYAVSDESGAFSITKLPPGKYTIAAVHPTLGEKTQDVEVAPNQTATVSFAF